jgi:hypothetical protein
MMIFPSWLQYPNSSPLLQGFNIVWAFANWKKAVTQKNNPM